ncbi:MAG: hypothetical protein K2Y14_10000 [Burkholderiales bacterium]|nr:hypothetical protein [Burkholderiales bacterium]
MDNDQRHKVNHLADEIQPVKVISTQDSLAHHGIALEIFGRGVVIVGKSGIGKSELGLELVDRGHRLICDDLVEGQLIDQQIIIRSPEEFALGFMEVRGIGFIDIIHLYGQQQMCAEKELFIVIQLVDNDMLDIINNDRLMQLIGNVVVLGITVPLYQLPIGANRNLPILVELIVKYAIDREQGFDSHVSFMERQTKFIQGKN